MGNIKAMDNDDDTLLINGKRVLIEEMPREQLIQFIKTWKPLVARDYILRRALQEGAAELAKQRQVN